MFNGKDDLKEIAEEKGFNFVGFAGCGESEKSSTRNLLFNSTYESLNNINPSLITKNEKGKPIYFKFDSVKDTSSKDQNTVKSEELYNAINKRTHYVQGERNKNIYPYHFKTVTNLDYFEFKNFELFITE